MAADEEDNSKMADGLTQTIEGLTKADHIRHLASRIGIKVPCHPEHVDVYLRKELAMAVGYKRTLLWNADSALRSKRQLSAVSAELSAVLDSAAARLAKEHEENAEARTERERQEREAAARKAELVSKRKQLDGAKLRAARRKSKASEAVSLQIPHVRLTPPFEGLNDAIAAWAVDNRRSAGFCITEALQRQLVDRELATIEAAEGGGAKAMTPIARLNDDTKHLWAAVVDTTKRLQKKFPDKTIKRTDVIRTALVRFLRAKGYWPVK